MIMLDYRDSRPLYQQVKDFIAAHDGARTPVAKAKKAAKKKRSL